MPASDLVILGSLHALRSNTFTMLGDPQRGEQEADLGLRTIAGTGLLKQRVMLMLHRAGRALMGRPVRPGV